MRKAAKLLAIAAIVSIAVSYGAEADLADAPIGLRGAIRYIKFDAPTLPPLAFTVFCLRYENECRPRRTMFRGGRLKLTPERWTELNQVNRQVNLAIRPEPNLEGLAGEKWLLHPASGECHDYAVTKRHDLIAKGFPAHAVLLSEVVTSWGLHHLVAVVRTFSGDLVLDNLSPRILPWSKTPYRWVRIQTPKNPNYWASVADPSV